MNPPDNFDNLLAGYLMLGFSGSNHCVTGTTLTKIPADEGGGYRAWVEMLDLDTEISSMSKVSWYDAADRVVRQCLWFLAGRDEPLGGSFPEAN